ncbi:uncharacterized protein LOC130657921 isoform X1 [Hydractinia symbiolongicarpus]|uniref:uncharacterized protein LOC130657921 isoform X1 n=1 Tax=Hydractinia symbiolongicarpus TaxID=13093 RepID=UPI00254F10DB|nr:uncharacterized protein LOC130657921 isoform X1 [Hydractinia symbiolongicarpus]
MSATNSSFASHGWGGRLKKMVKLKTSNTEPSSESPRVFEVNLIDGKTITVDLVELKKNIKDGELLVKDVVKEICRKMDIMPKSAAFFGIKCDNPNGSSMWIVQTRTMENLKVDKKQKCYFKLQFKVLPSFELRKRDLNAYYYYVKQCRSEFRSGCYSKLLEGKDNEKILLRMVILEMMMVAKEENINSLKDMLKSKHKKMFNMDEILRKHSDKEIPRDISKCKQKVEKSLRCFEKVQEPDRDFTTEVELLRHFREETYLLQKYERGGNKANNVELWISPSGISKKVLMSNVKSSLWDSQYNMLHQFKVCETDPDKGIKTMIFRGDEPPEIVYCASEEICESISSFLDGYYRLLVDQYNSILHDFSEYLQCSRYHGPIEREIVPRILTVKGRQQGNFLIREHSKKYGSYVLSVISEDDEFCHLQILKSEVDGRVIYLLDESRKFDSLEQLIEHYSNEENGKEIKSCLRKIILPKHSGNVPLYSDPSTFRPALPGRKVIHTQPNVMGPSLLDPNQMTMERHIKQGTFGEVMKSLTYDGRELIVKRFPNLSSEMLHTVSQTLTSLQQHESIVQFLGLSLSSNDMFLAFEYLPIGTLESYLNENRKEITYGTLLKFLMQLTDALAFLHSEKLVHADVRFNNIYIKDENTIKLGNCCITWKLAGFKMLDEKIFQKRFTHLAPEIFLCDNAEFSQKTDVWSYGLTVWQLFTLEKPFRNCSSHQLMTFFKKQMEPQFLDEAPLIQLNMNILRHCNELLFDLFTLSLHMKSEKRGTMQEIFHKVQEILDKAPSKDKQKCYFSYDWQTRNQEIEANLRLQGMGQRTKFQLSGDSGYATVGTYSCESLPLKNGSAFVESNNNTSGGDSVMEVVVNEKESVKATPKESEVVQKCLFQQGDDAETKKMEDEPIEKLDTIKKENGSEEEMSQDSSSPPEKLDESMEVERLNRKTSQSAPSSPTRPKMFRSMSVNEPSKRDEQEFETASILVGLSQAKGPRPEQPVRPPPNSNMAPVFYVPQGYSLLGTPVRPNSTPHNGKPVKLAPRPASQEYVQNFQMQQQAVTRNSNNINVPAKETPPPSPRPVPPDSPDASRRDYATEQPRREIVKDDKTRKFLQERINRERDRSRGKRSLSFTEEFDEYKNNTKRAAKRALMGPNPFNIGIKLPEDFLLRTNNRSYPVVQTLPRDVTRFFSNDKDTIKPVPAVKPKDLYVDSSALNPYIESSALNPYKTERDIKQYRDNILRNKFETMSSPVESHYVNPDDMQTVLDGIQGIKAHSPISVGYEEPKSVFNKTNNSIAVSSTIGVFEKFSGKTSIQGSIRFPYGHTMPSDPTLSPYIMHPRVTVATSSTKPVGTRNEMKVQFSSHVVSPMYAPPQIALATDFPTGRVVGGPYFPINSALNQFPNPRVIAINSGPYTNPPTLQRQGGQPAFVVPLHGISPSPRARCSNPFNPPNPVSITDMKPDVKVKSEPQEQKPLVCSVYEPAMTRLPAGGYEPIKTPNVPGPFTDSSNCKETSDTLFRYIPSRDLKLEEPLGKGQFGDVFKGKWMFKDRNKVTHQIPVAVKRLKRTDEPVTQEALLDFKREAEKMAELNNDKNQAVKYIIKLYGVCTDDEHVFSIVTELALAPLDIFISSRKRELSIGDIFHYCKQIACGMEYLHSKKVLHRDLACRNILARHKHLVKISDFGLSRLLHDKGYYRIKSENTKLPLQWLSLEAIEKKRFTQESDYWSFGVTMWEMFTLFDPKYTADRAYPYKEIEPKDLYNHLRDGNRLQKPEQCPDKLWEHIAKCWNVKTNTRPSFYIFKQVLKKLLHEMKYTT